MRVLKYSTKHLVCFEAKDQQNQKHHQIFEKVNDQKPVAIYSVDLNKLHLANEFPQNARQYKYFDEMCEIMTFLHSLKKSPTQSLEQ